MSNMGNLSGFNAASVQPQDDFEPLPAGWYTAVITESGMRPTRSGDGQYLQLRLDIIDGKYENRVVYERLNLDNPNPTAVEIAQRTLSAICHAVGNLTPNDSQELHNIPLQIKLGIEPASNGYEASNSIKAYAEPQQRALAAVQQQAAPQQAMAPQAPQAQAPAQQQAPWDAQPPAQPVQQMAAQQGYGAPHAQAPAAPPQQPQQQAAPQAKPWEM